MGGHHALESKGKNEARKTLVRIKIGKGLEGGVGIVRLLYRCLRGGEGRNIALLRLSNPPNLFQPHSDTASNRYPRVFKFVREEVGDGPDRRILSFGCSTGEEVFSLRTYFPQASITGLDINPRNIAVCGTRLAASGDPRISFAVAGSTAAEAAESYDLICAMAVFRHGDLGSRPPRCDHLIRFADFERTVTDLARCLRPGGMLAIRNANFRFSDTGIAAAFEPVLRLRNNQPISRTPLYGPDNCLLDDPVYPEIVFRKRGQAATIPGMTVPGLASR